MKLHQLKAFLSVIDKGSFSEAALSLQLSQASVSHAVAELEKSLGVKLLERGRFGAKATEIAKPIVEQVRLIFQAQAAIEQSISLTKGVLKGDLRVASHPSLASKVIPGIFASLQKDYPDLSLDLQIMTSNEDLEQALHNDQADIALLLYESSAELLTWQLIEDEFIALVPNSYALERDLIGAKELTTFPNILQRGRQCGEVVRAYLEDLGVSVKTNAFLDEGGQVTMSEGQIILDLVSQGLGIALVASMLVNHVPQNVRTLRLETPLHRKVIAAINPSKLKMPAVRVCLNAFKQSYPNSELAHLGVNIKQQAA